MIVLYGAGEELKKLLEKSKNDLEDIVIVDSDPNKYGKVLREGYKVKDPNIITKMSSDDFVIITTSEKYYSEIYSNVKKLNQNAAIYQFIAAKWILYKRAEIANYINLEDNYHVNIDVTNWINSVLGSELSFWEKTLKEKREKISNRFKERDFTYSADAEIVFTEEDIILDLGCGPCPIYGNRINGKTVRYIPLDPLAHQYSKLLKRNDVTLPVEPKFAIMEMLTCFYKEGTVDYVIIDNALDHCIDILRALIECFRVIKNGGFLLMRHMDSEGIHNDYEGMHQWNITCTDTDLIFFNGEGAKINISKFLQPYAEIELNRIPMGYRDRIAVKIKKTDDLPDEILDKYDDKALIGELIDRLFEKLL